MAKGTADERADGMVDFSWHIGPGDNQLPAMWVFQDLRRAWEYVRNSAGGDPSSVTARWENDQNCLVVVAGCEVL